MVRTQDGEEHCSICLLRPNDETDINVSAERVRKRVKFWSAAIVVVLATFGIRLGWPKHEFAQGVVPPLLMIGVICIYEIWDRFKHRNEAAFISIKPTMKAVGETETSEDPSVGIVDDGAS